MPDLNLRALDWLRGRWAAPTLCEREGGVETHYRRLVIAPAPRHVRPISNRITFHAFDVEGLEDCKDAFGRPAPDVRGSIVVTLPGMSRPDLAQAEFQRAMRSTGGFDFEIVSGRLRFTGWGADAQPRIVDFEGGEARVRDVRRGSDEARLLAAYDAPQKRTFELRSADGETTLAFPMVFYDFR